MYPYHTIPFCTHRYQYGDLVAVQWDPVRGMYKVLEVVAKSHRFETGFIIEDHASETELVEILTAIDEYDCVLADGSDRWYEVSLAPQVDVDEFESTLLKYVKKKLLTYDGDPFDARDQALKLRDKNVNTELN